MKNPFEATRPEGPPVAPEEAGKMVYEEPRLVRHGSLDEITAGGSGGPQGDLFGSVGFPS